jgi:hypothetical protein
MESLQAASRIDERCALKFIDKCPSRIVATGQISKHADKCVSR